MHVVTNMPACADTRTLKMASNCLYTDFCTGSSYTLRQSLQKCVPVWGFSKSRIRHKYLLFWFPKFIILWFWDIHHFYYAFDKVFLIKIGIVGLHRSKVVWSETPSSTDAVSSGSLAVRCGIYNPKAWGSNPVSTIKCFLFVFNKYHKIID